MDKTISIIIPVYKVERTLDRCVQSILNQDYTHWEMILVDDGSPDGCPKMCDEYASKYPNIHVIHQENRGLSDARNAGMELVKGELMIFLDSDDWLSENALAEIAVAFPENADLLFMDYTEQYDGDREAVVKRLFKQDAIDFANDSFYTKDTLEYSINDLYKEVNGTTGYSCTVVFNAVSLKKKNISFPSGTALMEDKVFMLNCLCRMDRIYYRSLSVYNYYIHDGTLSHSTYDGRADYVIRVFDKLKAYVLEIKCQDTAFRNRMIAHFTYLLLLAMLWRSAGTRDGDLKRKSRQYCRQSAQEVHQSGVKDFPASAKAIMFLCRHNRFAVLEWMISTYRRVQYSTLWKR